MYLGNFLSLILTTYFEWGLGGSVGAHPTVKQANVVHVQTCFPVHTHGMEPRTMVTLLRTHPLSGRVR